MALGRDELDRAVEDGLLTRAQADALWARADDREPPSERAAAPDRLRAALAVGAGLVAAGVGAWLLVSRRSGSAAPAPRRRARRGGGARGRGPLLERRGLAAGGVLALAVAMVPVAVARGPGVARALRRGVAPPPPSGVPRRARLPAPRSPVLPPRSLALASSRGRCSRRSRSPRSGSGDGRRAGRVRPGAVPEQRALLSALVGLAALGTGVALDGRTRRDHAYWLYLAGLVAFWGGLTTHQPRATPRSSSGRW